MIALFITFFAAVVLLFLGLNKKESSFSNLAVVALLASSIGSFCNAKGLFNLPILESWVPANMMLFGYSEHMFVSLLAFVAAVIVFAFRRNDNLGADQLGLIMFSLCGAFMMLSFQHIVMLFMGIEVLSIPLYVLAGSKKDSLASNEASLKYFLMGAFSTGIFLLGTAFIYGGTGSMELEMMGIKPSFMHAMEGMPIPTLINAGLILMSVGLLFKVAAAPFHFWAPDVYEGSPNRTTVFMATIVKITAFVAFNKLLSTFGGIHNTWSGWLCVLGMITIVWGNLAGLVQNGVKRTLAFSSIAHAGYLVMFLVILDETKTWILWYYGFAYALASVLVFLISHQSTSDKHPVGFDMFNGLSKRSPWVAFALVVGVLSMAGIPISAGFDAKFYLFSFAWQSSPWLVGVGLLGSAISIGYYFKFIKYAFLVKVNEDQPAIEYKDKVLMMMIATVLLVAGALPWVLLKWVF